MHCPSVPLRQLLQDGLAFYSITKRGTKNSEAIAAFVDLLKIRLPFMSR